MKKKKPTILARKSDLRIIQLHCCDNVGFMFNNLLLNFTSDGFLDFSTSFQKLDFDKRAITFANRVQRLVINTYQKEMRLCFTHSEFKMVCKALKEAEVMLEVNQILYS